MISPQFDVGQKVFVASTEFATEHVECPDCKGTREWKVITPAGEEFASPCGTCTYGYEVRGFIVKKEWRSRVFSYTIGSVRIDTHDDRPISYMMDETGVGSGSVYYEEDVFGAHFAALSRADEKTKERRAEEADRNTKQRERERKQERRRPPYWKKAIREWYKAYLIWVNDPDPSIEAVEKMHDAARRLREHARS